MDRNREYFSREEITNQKYDSYLKIENFCELLSLFLSLSERCLLRKNIIQSNLTQNFTFKYIRTPTVERLPRGPFNDGPEPSIRGLIEHQGCWMWWSEDTRERGKLLLLFNDFVSSCNRADRFFPACLSPRIDVGIIIRFNKNGLSVKQWTVACRTGYRHGGRC